MTREQGNGVDGVTSGQVNKGTSGQVDARIVNKRTSLPVYKLTSRRGRVNF